MQLAATVVIPAYNEEGIADVLAPVSELGVAEILVVVDSPHDLTVSAARAVPGVTVLVQPGRGPAAAIRHGVMEARQPSVVVMMADGCDDPRAVPLLVGAIESGAVVASASRYCRGGRRIGGPKLKGIISRSVGVSLRLLAGVGTSDATNAFKAYSASFVRTVGMDSSASFAGAIELVAKAHRARQRVVEIPTTWTDRGGPSRFRILAWAPEYLRWYAFAFGPELTMGTPQPGKDAAAHEASR